jgi:hypothetical protein
LLLTPSQSPPRLGTLLGSSCVFGNGRLRVQCVARLNVQLPGNRQSFANLETRQRRSQLAAVCAVDLARVKTAVTQFFLHRLHIVVGANRSDKGKTDADGKQNNTILMFPHTWLNRTSRLDLPS